ncbi:MAG: hypothetical protein AAF717_17870 [Bacteroidota bacterium]
MVPLLVFFLSTKKWWKYALLLPILITTYQLKNALNPDNYILDEQEVLQAAPFMLAVVLLLLLLSKAAYYQSKVARIYKTAIPDLEQSVKSRFKQRDHYLEKTKKQLNQLKYAKKTNKEELLQLKHQLEQELQDYRN